MALVKLSNEIISIRGQLGGVYFKTDPNGQHIQAMPRHVNYPRSAFQLAGTNAWTGMSGLFMLALVGAFMAAWIAYAAVFWFTTRTGERKRISAYNWYMHYAMMFPETQNLPFWKPPHNPGDLPHYVSTSRGQWMYEHTPVEWPADLAAGMYWPGMDYNGEVSFRTDDYEWFIWWRGDVWALSKSLGWEPPATTYYSPGIDIVGRYKNPFTNKYAKVFLGRP